MTGHSMDLVSLLRLVVRWWRLTGPAAVLTLVGVVAAVQLASPTYQATGSVVLLSPPEAPDADAGAGATAPVVGQNPYVRYGDLAVVADIVARVMDSDSRRAELEAREVAAYEVVANREARGPVVEVTGEGPSAAAAIGSTEVVLADLAAVLSDLQEVEGADPGYFITAAPLEPPSTAAAMYGSTVRAAIGAAAFGALATLGVAVVAEAVARRRRAGVTPAPTIVPVAGTDGAGRPTRVSSGAGRVESVPDAHWVRSASSDRWRDRPRATWPAPAPVADPPTDDRRAQPTTDLRP